MAKTLIGDDVLFANLAVLKEHMNHAVADGMRKFGGEIETTSTELCPVKVGELRSRVFNEGPLLDDDVYIQVIGYEKFVQPVHNSQTIKQALPWGQKEPKTKGISYAVPVHERTYVQHKTGEAKFLEKAVNKREKEFNPYIQKILKKVKL